MKKCFNKNLFTKYRELNPWKENFKDWINGDEIAFFMLDLYFHDVSIELEMDSKLVAIQYDRNLKIIVEIHVLKNGNVEIHKDNCITLTTLDNARKLLRIKENWWAT